jgi:hypothetical protein
MNGLLVRVGADLSSGGGSWNGPIDCASGSFTYVAIPESRPLHAGLEKPYNALSPALASFGVSLPATLATRHMHLDPDFEHLTYGDQGERAKQLKSNLDAGDLIVFYAGLSDVRGSRQLIYALIGLFVVDSFQLAIDVPPQCRDINAHSRRTLQAGADDMIVHAKPGQSGRLTRGLNIGEYRDRAYRMRRDVLDAWGGLSVKDGYLQRSARLPRLLDTPRFLNWFHSQKPQLIAANN